MDEVIVEIKGHQYQIGNFTARVGVSVFNRVLKAVALSKDARVYMGYLTDEDYEYITNAAIAIVQRENEAAPGSYVPIYSQTKQKFAFKDLENDNGASLLKILTEVIGARTVPFFADPDLFSQPILQE